MPFEINNVHKYIYSFFAITKKDASGIFIVSMCIKVANTRPIQKGPIPISLNGLWELQIL